MLKVALKDLFARKRRMVTTAIAIILGISFLSGTQLLSAALSDSIKGLIGDVYENIDAVVRSPDSQDTPFGQSLRNPVPAELVEQIDAVDGVKGAQGVVEGVGPQLIGKDGKVFGSAFGPPTIVYNAFESGVLSIGKLIEGRDPTAPDEVSLDFDTTTALGLGLGDEVKVATLQEGTESFTLVGIGGLGEDGEKSTGARPMTFTTETAMRLMDQPGQYNYIAVVGDEGIDQTELTARLAEALPSEQILTGQAFTDESAESIAQFVGILNTFVSVFGYIALFIAIFIIYNTFSITVAQRTRETALLRAIGARRKQVLAATLFEALIIGLIAAVGGLLVGLALAAVLLQAVGSMFTVDSVVPPLSLGTVLFALITGVVVTMVSAIAPAIRSTKVPPVAAMSEVAVDRTGVSLARKIWGAALLVVGVGLILAGVFGADSLDQPLIFVGIGAAITLMTVAIVVGPVIAAPVSKVIAAIIPGRSIATQLAGENAARNPRRTAATAAALTIGVTLVVVISVLASSIKSSVDSALDSSIKADLVIASAQIGALGSIPASVEPQVEAVPGVKVASPVRFGLLRLLDDAAKKHATTDDEALAGLTGAGDSAPPGQDEFTLGIDPESWFDVVDAGEIEGSISDLGPDTLAVSKFYAEDRDWKLGDEIPVFFAATGEKQLKVAVIYSTEVGDSALLLPMATFEPNMLQVFNSDYQIYVALDEGADLATVTADINKVLADLPTVVVQNLREFIEAQVAPFDTFLAIIYGLLGLAIFIALIGIGNTLSLSVLERTRELGVLRAVGMSRKQLRRMIRREAGIIALFGTLLGIGLGVALAWALTIAVSAGIPQAVNLNLPVVQLIVIAVIAAGAGVLAAILPARRAAKLDPLEAIASV